MCCWTKVLYHLNSSAKWTNGCLILLTIFLCDPKTSFISRGAPVVYRISRSEDSATAIIRWEICFCTLFGRFANCNLYNSRRHSLTLQRLNTTYVYLDNSFLYLLGNKTPPGRISHQISVEHKFCHIFNSYYSESI